MERGAGWGALKSTPDGLREGEFDVGDGGVRSMRVDVREEMEKEENEMIVVFSY